MQQAKQHSIARFGPVLRGGYAEQAALALAAKSGEYDAVPGLAGVQVSDLRRAVLAAIPPSLLASDFGRFQLRQRCVVSVAVPSSSEAWHNRSLQRTASPPAELAR